MRLWRRTTAVQKPRRPYRPHRTFISLSFRRQPSTSPVVAALEASFWLLVLTALTVGMLAITVRSCRIFNEERAKPHPTSTVRPPAYSPAYETASLTRS